MGNWPLRRVRVALPRTRRHGVNAMERAGSDHLARARRLAPEIAAFAERIEAERRLPEPLLALLHEAGLYRLLLPRAFGGAEIDPRSFVEIIETIAVADASTAWCLCQAAGCSMVAAFLKREVAATIFGTPRAILAWGPGPARAVAGGGVYRLSGNWSFASGGRHASWLGGQAPIVEADGTPRLGADGLPAIRTMLFPAERAAMTDIWRVIGLRGTGSDAYSVSDLVVAHDYSVARDDQAERREAGPLYCFPTSSLYASGFAGVALGIARATLDAFIDLAANKIPRGFKHSLRDNAVVQSEVARAEARLLSARLFLIHSLDEIWREVARVNALTIAQRIRIRLAATYAIGAATAVVDTAYHAAGATAVFDANPFERRFRDIHTVAQQVQGRASHFETVGQFLLGLEPDLLFL
jgi:alkylation response protein AidB-like acyl-CoA dehydrogenase